MSSTCTWSYISIATVYLADRRWWLSGNALNYQSRGPGFKSRSNLGKFLAHFSGSLALVYPDGGQGASRVSMLYIGHVKEPRGIFETS